MLRNEQKFCKDSVHISNGGFDLCFSPHNGISAVTGEIQPSLAVSQRSDFRTLNGLPDTNCGPEGKYFKPKVEVQPVSFWNKILQLFKSF